MVNNKFENMQNVKGLGLTVCCGNPLFTWSDSEKARKGSVGTVGDFYPGRQQNETTVLRSSL
jgi:hypothetical protein